MFTNFLEGFRIHYVKFFLCLCFFKCVFGVYGQQDFPVKTQAIITNPSVLLEDYTLPQNMRVLVNLADANESNYSILLKISFSKDGYKFNSKVGLPLTLQGGQVYTLDQTELVSLFSASDLESSNNQGAVSSVGGVVERVIPEGTYTVQLEAIDVRTGIVVSNKTIEFTQIIVQKYDPPLVALPVNNTVIKKEDIKNSINFSWTPRSIGLSATSDIRYELKIVEVNPVTRSPYDALSTNTFRLETYKDLISTTQIYDQSSLSLKEGVTYAWQVQAYELRNGKRFVSKFRNGGFSEAYVFRVEEDCDVLGDVVVGSETEDVETKESLIALSWSKGKNHQGYQLSYREAGTLKPWQIMDLGDKTGYVFSSSSIKRGVEYEYTLEGRCKSWLDESVEGKVQLKAKPCEAPFPILIDKKDEDYIYLKWDPIAKADRYEVYSLHDSYSEEGEDIVTVPSIAIERAETDIHKPYTIHVTSHCADGQEGEGEILQLTEDDESIVGACPLPKPFELFTEQSTIDPTLTTLTWSHLPTVHKEFVLTYWNSSDPTKKEEVKGLTTPTTDLPNLVRGQLYYYTVKAICTDKKEVRTNQGGFQVENPVELVVTNETTADCFPPKYIGAEAQDNTTAKFEWSRVDEAEKYELTYRLKDTEEDEVFETTAAHAKIKDLPTGVYEYSIQAVCESKKSIPTKIGEVDLRTPKEAGSCDSLIQFEMRKLTSNNIQIGWTSQQKTGALKTISGAAVATNPVDIHTGYVVEYKESGQVWAEAYTKNLNNLSELEVDLKDKVVEYTIPHLKGNTTYNIRITAHCHLNEALKNEPLNVTTTEETVLGCEDPDACNRSNTTPVKGLKIGDKIKIHTVELVIEEVEADGDTWTGKGVAETKLLGIDKPIRMMYGFDKAVVNEEYCVISSDSILATNVMLVPDDVRNQIKDITDQIDAVIDQAQTYTDMAASLTGGAKDLFNAFNDPIDTSGYAGFTPLQLFQEGKKKAEEAKKLGDDIYNGVESATKLSEIVKLTKISAWLIKKALKEGYEEVEETIGLDAKPGYVMKFSAKPGEEEYFDAYETRKELKEFYQQVDQLEGDKYVVPHVAVEKGKTREVVVTFTSPTAIQDDKVYFVTTSTTRQVGADVLKDQLSVDVPAGDRLTYTKVGTGIYKVTVPSDKGHVYAMYAPDDNTKHRLGKLNVIEIEPKVKKLVVVPNGNPNFSFADASAIQTELNKVYKVAGITFEVEFPRHNFKPSKFENGLKVSDEKLMSRYSASMKAYRKAFEEAGRNLESDKYYLFVVDKLYDSLAPSQSIEGFMPRNKQYGFISAEFNVTLNTIAHEYGHGIFTLEHTWDVDKGQPKESTQNLMDYNEGTELIGAQWKRIQKPGWQPYALDKKEDASSVVISNIAALKPFKKGDCYSFISPASLPISLPSTIKSVEFFDEKEAESTSGKYHPLGALRAFTLANGKRFVAGYDFSKDLFNGYYDHKNKKFYIDELTKTEPSGDLVIVGRTKVKESKYYIELYQKEFDKNYVPGLTGWPTTDNYKASGAIGLNQYYFRLDGLLNPLKKEYLISSITYTAGKTQVLSFVNGLSHSKSMYQVLYLGKKAAIHPSDFYDFVVCKGFEKYEDYVARVKRQDEDKTRSSIDSDYAEYLKQKKNDFYSFVNGQGKSSFTVWLKNAKNKWKDSNTTSYSEAKQIINDAKCLTISYTDALKSLPFEHRRNAIRILRENSNEDPIRDLMVKTPSDQKTDQYANIILAILAEFADKGDYDEKFGLEMLNLMGAKSEGKCYYVTHFIHQLLASRQGGDCIFQGLIYRYSDKAFDNDNNFELFFTKLLSLCYLKNAAKYQITTLKTALDFTDAQLTTYSANQNYDRNIFIWNGSAVQQNTKTTYSVYGSATGYHQYKVNGVDCSSYNLIEGQKTSRTFTSPQFGTTTTVSSFTANNTSTYNYFSDWVLFVDKTKGEVYPVPALWAYFLVQNQNNKISQKAVQVAINLASLATGVGSIAAGARGTLLVVAIIDVSTSITGIVTITYEQELRTALGDEGYELLETVNNLVSIAGIGIQSAPGIASKAKKLCGAIDESKRLGKLSSLPPTVKSKLTTIRDKLATFFPKLANAGSDWLVTLKSNTSFKSYLDDLIANPSSRKFTNTLAVEEEAVLKFYTTNPGYKDFNKAIRGEIPMTEFYTAQKNLMEQALGKLPNSVHNSPNTLMYRIENLTDAQISSIYVEGSTITKNAFTSATHSEGAIIDAIRSRPYTVMIRVEGKNGKLIEDLSTLPGEKEVLFTTGTKFEVTQVGFAPNPDDFMTPLKTVWLKEL